MPRIYVVNRSSHDFSPALEWGEELIFLSEGSMNKYAITDMYRQFSERMDSSQPHDYILPCALSNMNLIAASIFAHKHGRLNLLLYKQGKDETGRFGKHKYIERTLMFDGQTDS